MHALLGSTYLSLGQLGQLGEDLGTDEEAQSWYQGASFNWGKLAETTAGVITAAAPAAITAFAPQPVQQGLQRGAAALPEEYRAYFQQYLPAASQPQAVMVRPQSSFTSALPWLIGGALLLGLGGKFLR